ncbi:FAD binding domain-containing protein [Aspergillus cavernicola]|uniref:FAD binding domain-containing protein n=1 Tax=Aspergillus cavernicola TaxID=176166 RepID=A0ABR4I4U8_9EURO
MASRNKIENDIDTDVVIVGAGVIGLEMTILLNDLGVKTFTIARHRGTAPAPRAHITNMRTMEIFRDMNIEKVISEVLVPLKDLGSAWIGTSLTGLELGRYSSYGAGDEQFTHYALSSPCKMESTPQNHMEGVMLKRARETAADIRFFTELVSIEQSPDGVLARVRDRGSQVEYRVHACYAVGADAGRSTVAEQLGFGFTGKPGLMSMISSWLEMDLEKYTSSQPACLWWRMQAGNEYWVGSGLLLCIRPWNEWTLQWQYDPTQGEPDTSDEAIIEYARNTLGVHDPDLKFRVKRVTKWQEYSWSSDTQILVQLSTTQLLSLLVYATQYCSMSRRKHPGAFLLHAWLEYKKCRILILDVLQYGKFGLIVGIGGQSWVSAAAKLRRELEVELPVHSIVKRCVYDDVLNEWTGRQEINDYGAQLVRPDRYIAWRCSDRHSDPYQALRSALYSILDRDIL